MADRGLDIGHWLKITTTLHIECRKQIGVRKYSYLFPQEERAANHIVLLRGPNKHSPSLARQHPRRLLVSFQIWSDLRCLQAQS